MRVAMSENIVVVPLSGSGNTCKYLYMFKYVHICVWVFLGPTAAYLCTGTADIFYHHSVNNSLIRITNKTIINGRITVVV